MPGDDQIEPRPNSRDAILAAAIAEFAEHGRDGVRMEQVAERAGVNKSLVYRHFENRENLFDEALRSVFAQRFTLLEDLPQDLAKLFDLWNKRFQSDSRFIHLIMREALELRDRDPPLHDQLRSQYYTHQIESIKQLQQQGDLPADADSESLFLMLMAILVFPHLLPQVATLVTGNRPDSAKFKRAWKKTFNLLIARLQENETT